MKHLLHRMTPLLLAALATGAFAQTASAGWLCYNHVSSFNHSDPSFGNGRRYEVKKWVYTDD